ncbi:hypothetical protein [Ferruginibacter sp.]|nr:hypothetical protein [Ferruginibacter sp.]
MKKSDQQRNMRQPDIADPAEAEGMPAKILPIIGKGNLKPGNDSKEAANEVDVIAQQDESDQSDNSGATSENTATTTN